jgi:hypothetical protein
MMYQVIGKCGRCGGPVGYESGWMSTLPQRAHCGQCGANAKNSYGGTIEMEEPATSNLDELLQRRKAE